MRFGGSGGSKGEWGWEEEVGEDPDPRDDLLEQEELRYSTGPN